jgi:hypothetical protein
MKVIGKSFGALLILLTIVGSFGARAELTASVDRDRVAMGDILRLTISATANEAINNVDLRPLLQDFDILQRSSSSSTSIINGNRTNTREVILEISPKREGTLRVPSLRVGRSETNYLLISVGPGQTASGDPLVSFEAELDRDNVYVQGQAILILRIQQAINLDSRSVTELTLDNAFIKQLEQKSFQRTIEGRPWLVHEIRYAIFPEQSGELEIPSQTFSARETQPRRSMFDLGNSGRQITRRTEALTIKVLPRPGKFPGDTWLPARKVEIAESWSTPPEQLRVGESATRRITISGEGLQGAQLPPILFPATSGLKYYPDQPVISDGELATGLVGSREDSAALVPTREGDYSIPEIRIPWWDTESGVVRYAVLPARNVTVAASLDASAPPIIPSPAVAPAFDTTPITVKANEENGSLWKVLAGFSTAGWVVTLLLFMRRGTTTRKRTSIDEENLEEAAAFKQLLAACASERATNARRCLITWASTLLAEKSIHSLDQVESEFGDAELSAELKIIEDSLYSSNATGWDGTGLTQIVKRLRKSHSSRHRKSEPGLRLYPSQA